jgi:hypothetical protein
MVFLPVTQGLLNVKSQVSQGQGNASNSQNANISITEYSLVSKLEGLTDLRDYRQVA